MMKAWLRDNGEGGNGRDAAVRSFLRFTAIAVVVAATIIAIGEASRTDDASRTVAPSATARDPFAADLARCRDVTAEQLAADDTCRRVWAENRRRFFAPNNKPAEAR
jgi:conjugative transfer region protein TrbK